MEPTEPTAASDISHPAGLFSLVGTPIGNLSDVSPRVSATLAAADVVLCEDTRVTGKLLSCLGVHASLERCDENVIRERTQSVLDRLAAGERVAFVSDAGMPGVSDPGSVLMDAALAAGVATEVIPGPSAVTCAVAASGLACRHFLFEGFLPRKAGERDRLLVTLSQVPAALVIYESPHRAVATLAAIAVAMPARRVALVRELTKVHEEVSRGTAPELAASVAARVEAEPLKGECVIVVEEPAADEVVAAPADVAARPSLDEAIAEGIRQGSPKSALARRIARAYGITRDEAYRRVVELSRKG
ncbi:MAG: 16S rRNA (cytidine(1402)-2'-O)-methyltransferase [Atopobiaceae bacterium]|nr:16S rRNA (cytidine(1402)-2'-O)-methyltransferase [Atopobiaceae bacterium]MCH4180155.1 16S rRNA (cytidine(1402)-2'-O)-methyltransferase [Atopobiaceae bacterium]MCH4230647.1 16S rRNA (cytidine(1402)-2'-O)-methyltransferase [Atopobiaceae bacterium]MCH4276615.1 16S rRNA (cytidine(1402)-2'-O)-methyltransferase [Atopobiaceae bacterium]MCI1260498.1 16S rRNA (cytidine(1402)-2'-O)-methyltransferase [Atopobiaceae bacterium]